MLASLDNFTTVKYELRKRWCSNTGNMGKLMTEDLAHALHMRLCIINNMEHFSTLTDGRGEQSVFYAMYTKRQLR